jgi:hypothetical protein
MLWTTVEIVSICSMYRQLTSTKRCITLDSFHLQSHKNATFYSMAHRLNHFQLSNEKYKREKENIIDMGLLIRIQEPKKKKTSRRYEKIKKRQDNTTFSSPRSLPTKRISEPFLHVYHQKTATCVFPSIRNNFETTKDFPTFLLKFGIYEVYRTRRSF